MAQVKRIPPEPVEDQIVITLSKEEALTLHGVLGSLTGKGELWDQLDEILRVSDRMGSPAYKEMKRCMGDTPCIDL